MELTHVVQRIQTFAGANLQAVGQQRVTAGAGLRLFVDPNSSAIADNIVVPDPAQLAPAELTALVERLIALCVEHNRAPCVQFF